MIKLLSALGFSGGLLLAQTSTPYTIWGNPQAPACGPWEVAGEILYLKPSGCNLTYVIPSTSTIDFQQATETPQSVNAQLLPQGSAVAIDPKNHLGFRLSAGRLFCWGSRDLSFQFTAFHSTDRSNQATNQLMIHGSEGAAQFDRMKKSKNASFYFPEKPGELTEEMLLLSKVAAEESDKRYEHWYRKEFKTPVVDDEELKKLREEKKQGSVQAQEDLALEYDLIPYRETSYTFPTLWPTVLAQETQHPLTHWIEKPPHWGPSAQTEGEDSPEAVELRVAVKVEDEDSSSEKGSHSDPKQRYEIKKVKAWIYQPNELVPAETYARFHVDYDAAELQFASRFFWGCDYWIRPYFGLHGARIADVFRIHYEGTTHPLVANWSRIDLDRKREVWGVGPQFGVDARWDFVRGFGLGVHISGALLGGGWHGRFHQSQETGTYRIQSMVDPKGKKAIFDSPLKNQGDQAQEEGSGCYSNTISRRGSHTMPELRARLGLNYTYWCNEKTLFVCEVGYEWLSYFKAMPQLPDGRGGRFNSRGCDPFNLSGIYIMGRFTF